MAPKQKRAVKGKAAGGRHREKPKTAAKCPKPAGDTPDKAFPLEKGPTPSKLEPTDITNLYRLPDGKLKTEEDVIKKYGYKLEEKLDAGGFGVIFFARQKKRNLKVACKLMELGEDWRDSRVRDMKNELFIMEKVKQLYVIKLFSHFLTSSKNGNRLYIFMQLADGGNFAKFIMKKGVLTETESKLYFAQIVCGINHMHSLGIAHRDIKLQNVLLLKNDKSISGDFTLLMADFGLSRIIHHEAGGGIVQNRTVCGTPLFMAPEILDRRPYSGFLVDVWALGITAFILVTLEIPFDFSNLNSALECDLKAITEGMMEPDPKKRLTLSQVIRHKWMAAEFKKAQALANKTK